MESPWLLMGSTSSGSLLSHRGARSTGKTLPWARQDAATGTMALVSTRLFAASEEWSGLKRAKKPETSSFLVGLMVYELLYPVMVSLACRHLGRRGHRAECERGYLRRRGHRRPRSWAQCRLCLPRPRRGLDSRSLGVGGWPSCLVAWLLGVSSLCRWSLDQWRLGLAQRPSLLAARWLGPWRSLAPLIDPVGQALS